MPTPHVTPPANGTTSTWQIGTYNAVADTWTLVLDLNDRSTWFIKSYDLAQPEKLVSRSGNPRTQGDRITNERYRNRYISLTLQLRSTTTLAAIDSAIHSLEAALSNTPFMLRFAEAQAAQYSYAICKSWQHNIPQDPLQRLAYVKTGITLVLECEPFLLGDKLYLDNLVVNPGFEAPSGPGVQVFADTFANVNAYSVLVGSVPTVVSNVMTIPSGTQLAFGSPIWGAINQWTLRFTLPASGAVINPIFALHWTDQNNYLGASVANGAFSLRHVVGGTVHALTSSAPTLTAGSTYWIVLTQFPATSGNAPLVQGTLYNDSAGAAGTAVTNGALGPVATFDAVTAITGRPVIWSNNTNAMTVGGAFSNVHTLSLFGPGGWPMIQNFGTGLVSGAWEGAQQIGASGTTANTYPNGPVTSYGALRFDFPPAGTASATWAPYTGGAPGGTFAIPVAAAGNALGVSGWVKSSGLHASNGSSSLVVSEYNSSGTFLRNGAVQTVLGSATNAAWTQVSGTYTTGANCAYVAVACETHDTAIAGESANATVWFDNIQVWNQTTTGQTTMPYCELRFPQSPAQLMVSGLVGDVPTPVSLAVGTYVSSMAVQHTMNLVLGNKATPVAAARLVGPSVVRQTPNASSTIVPTLNSSFYGGFYIQENYTGATGSFTSYYYALSDTPANLAGIYWLVEQFMTSQANYSAIQAQATTIVSTGAYDPGAPTYAQRLAFIQTPSTPLTPVTAQNNQIDIGIGSVFIPPYGRDSLMDTTKNFVAPAIWWTDPNAANPTTYRHGWQALLPIDGGAVKANFTTGKLAAINTSWVWIYANGLDGQLLITGNWTYSLETAALANPANGVGGAGGINSSSQSIISVGDAFLTLDPTQSSNGVSGVQQLVGYLTNDNPLGAVLPLHASIQYTPHYLDPR